MDIVLVDCWFNYESKLLQITLVNFYAALYVYYQWNDGIFLNIYF